MTALAQPRSTQEKEIQMNAIKCIATALLLMVTLGARADITVGVILSLTGPGASLGIPEKNTVELMPTSLAGEKVKFIILDDASDTTTAVRNAQKLIAEDKIDMIIGPSISPTSVALLDTIGRAEVPMVSLAGGDVIVVPQEGARRWAFKMAPPEAIQGARIFDHLQKNGGKTIAFIAVANAFGESWTSGVNRLVEARNIKTVAIEKYNAADTSVTAQVLKVMAANPDAVLIASFGTPAALPVIELRRRGYKGAIYLNQGVANVDFLRVGGKDLDGSYTPVAPALVAEQLADSDPIKKVAMEWVNAYEGKHGPGSRSLFGATAWDAFLILKEVAPAALKAGAPGTAAFRRALRDGFERIRNLVTSQGVYSMSEKDHVGADARAQVLVRIENGKWVLVK
jgi:branched-chain amino acid transport system substrate-binding protein